MSRPACAPRMGSHRELTSRDRPGLCYRRLPHCRLHGIGSPSRCAAAYRGWRSSYAACCSDAAPFHPLALEPVATASSRPPRFCPPAAKRTLRLWRTGGCGVPLVAARNDGQAAILLGRIVHVDHYGQQIEIGMREKRIVLVPFDTRLGVAGWLEIE